MLEKSIDMSTVVQFRYTRWVKVHCLLKGYDVNMPYIKAGEEQSKKSLYI